MQLNTHTYDYIYIYIEREREGEGDRERERECSRNVMATIEGIGHADPCSVPDKTVFHLPLIYLGML